MTEKNNRNYFVMEVTGHIFLIQSIVAINFMIRLNLRALALVAIGFAIIGVVLIGAARRKRRQKS